MHGLEDTIICDLQLLFDTISALISAICFQTAISKEEELLRVSGRCSSKLLHRLLRKTSENHLSVETTIIILKHMRLVASTGSGARSAEASETCTIDSTESMEYFVPCVLRVFPVETMTATVRASPAPLLFIFERGHTPLGLFTQLLVYLASAEVQDWQLKGISLFRNMATFHVGEDKDEITLISRPTFYEVLFEGDEFDRCVPLDDACSAVRLDIDAAIEAVKSGLNSTIKIHHFAAFYCPLMQCASHPLHPAVCHNRKIKCTVLCKFNSQTPSQQVWFGKVMTKP